MNPIHTPDGTNRPIPTIEAGAAGGLGPSVSDVRSANGGEAMQTRASLFHEWKLDKVNDQAPAIGCIIKFIKKEAPSAITASGSLNGREISGDGTFIYPHLSLDSLGIRMSVPKQRTPEAHVETEIVFKVLKESVVEHCTEETLQLLEVMGAESAAIVPTCLIFKSNVTEQMHALSNNIQERIEALNQKCLFPIEPWQIRLRNNIVDIIVEENSELKKLGSTDIQYNLPILYGKWTIESGQGAGGEILIKEKVKEDSEEDCRFTIHYRDTQSGLFSTSGVSGQIRRDHLLLDAGNLSILGPLDFGEDIQIHAGNPNFLILTSGDHTYLLKSKNA